MEEGKDKICLSRSDFIALSQEFSDRDVKYARLQFQYDNEVKKTRELEEKIAVMEAALKRAEEEAQILRRLNERQQQDIDVMKSKITNMASSMQQPDIDVLQQAIEYLLQNNLLISILRLQAFMQERVSDLNTALALRAFVLECVPEQLRPAALTIVSKVMVLPEKPKPQAPINDNRTINLTGDHAIYTENPDPEKE